MAHANEESQFYLPPHVYPQMKEAAVTPSCTALQPVLISHPAEDRRLSYIPRGYEFYTKKVCPPKDGRPSQY